MHTSSVLSLRSLKLLTTREINNDLLSLVDSIIANYIKMLVKTA
jgi:hypothetical protein